MAPSIGKSGVAIVSLSTTVSTASPVDDSAIGSSRDTAPPQGPEVTEQRPARSIQFAVPQIQDTSSQPDDFLLSILSVEGSPPGRRASQPVASRPPWSALTARRHSASVGANGSISLFPLGTLAPGRSAPDPRCTSVHISDRDLTQVPIADHPDRWWSLIVALCFDVGFLCAGVVGSGLSAHRGCREAPAAWALMFLVLSLLTDAITLFAHWWRRQNCLDEPPVAFMYVLGALDTIATFWFVYGTGLIGQSYLTDKVLFGRSSNGDQDDSPEGGLASIDTCPGSFAFMIWFCWSLTALEWACRLVAIITYWAQQKPIILLHGPGAYLWEKETTRVFEGIADGATPLSAQPPPGGYPHGFPHQAPPILLPPVPLASRLQSEFQFIRSISPGFLSPRGTAMSPLRSPLASYPPRDYADYYGGPSAGSSRSEAAQPSPISTTNSASAWGRSVSSPRQLRPPEVTAAPVSPTVWSDDFRAISTHMYDSDFVSVRWDRMRTALGLQSSAIAENIGCSGPDQGNSDSAAEECRGLSPSPPSMMMSVTTP